MNRKSKEYNKEPVLYCKNCLSLRVKNMSDIFDYCDKCGSTDIQETTIDKWEEMYILRYGHKYLNIK